MRRDQYLTDGPAARGFRMPAEWSPHRATWFSWPHNLETWPDELDVVEEVLAAAAARIATGEELFINVRDANHRAHVEALLESHGISSRIRYFEIATNDAWTRDHGPLFITRESESGPEVAATTWGFNSWGGKYPPWDLDADAAGRMVEVLDVRSFDHDIILEGGSIDVNGAGMLLTTESCLLNGNRNPELSRPQLESLLGNQLGATQVVWLGDGIAGDDTDGHIDDIARFVGEYTVVAAVEEDTSDVNFEPLQDNLRRLEGVRSPSGRRLEIIPIPLPRPHFVKGERMPASYANFYIANRVVLVPTFADAADERALAILQRLFPDREVVGMDCRELIWGLGAIHCLTQQVPVGTAAVL